MNKRSYIYGLSVQTENAECDNMHIKAGKLFLRIRCYHVAIWLKALDFINVAFV